MDGSYAYSYASQPRQRRTARARREQRARAAARMAGGIIKASVILAEHRGCAPGRHLEELAALLADKPGLVDGKPTVENETAVPAAKVVTGPFKPRPMAQPRKPRACMERASLPYDYDSNEEFNVENKPTQHDDLLHDEQAGPSAACPMPPLRRVPALVQFFELSGQGGQLEVPMPLMVDQTFDSDGLVPEAFADGPQADNPHPRLLADDPAGEDAAALEASLELAEARRRFEEADARVATQEALLQGRHVDAAALDDLQAWYASLLE